MRPLFSLQTRMHFFCFFVFWKKYNILNFSKNRIVIFCFFANNQQSYFFFFTVPTKSLLSSRCSESLFGKLPAKTAFVHVKCQRLLNLNWQKHFDYFCFFFSTNTQKLKDKIKWKIRSTTIDEAVLAALENQFFFSNVTLQKTCCWHLI